MIAANAQSSKRGSSVRRSDGGNRIFRIERHRFSVSGRLNWNRHGGFFLLTLKIRLVRDRQGVAQ